MGASGLLGFCYKPLHVYRVERRLAFMVALKIDPLAIGGKRGANRARICGPMLAQHHFPPCAPEENDNIRLRFALAGADKHRTIAIRSKTGELAGFDNFMRGRAIKRNFANNGSNIRLPIYMIQKQHRLAVRPPIWRRNGSLR